MDYNYPADYNAVDFHAVSYGVCCVAPAEYNAVDCHTVSCAVGCDVVDTGYYGCEKVDAGHDAGCVVLDAGQDTGYGVDYGCAVGHNVVAGFDDEIAGYNVVVVDFAGIADRSDASCFRG